MSMAMQIQIARLEKQVAVLREDIDRLVRVIDSQDRPRGPGRPPKVKEAA